MAKDDSRSVVVILDDHPSTIMPQVDLLESYGFETHVFSGIMSFADALENWDRPEKDLKCIILDSHIPGSADLSSIGLPQIRTAGGHRVGEQIATRYLSTLKQFRDVPTIILTAFVESAEHSEEAVRRGIRFLSKGNPRTFEEFVRNDLVQPLELPGFALGAIVNTEAATGDGVRVALIQPAYDRILKILTNNPSLIYEIDPRKWEEIIAASYKNAGFDEVTLTPRSGDLGRDVIAVKRGFGSVKFIEQVKAFHSKHIVTANDVRALVGVLLMEQDASKAIFTTTSQFAPRLRQDRLLKPLLPTRLELVDKTTLIQRLSWKY